MNYRIGSMIACVIGVLLAVASCGSSDAAPLGKYNEECMVLDDCEAPLMCIQKLCTLQCMGDTECKAYDSKATCRSKYCANPCNVAQDCPGGLQCLTTPFGSPTCAAR